MSDPTIAVFDYATWTARYPELGTVPAGLAQLYFNEAGLYLDNTSASVVANVGRRTLLLYMITAHIAKLNATINGQAPSGLVGRLSSVSEGSVSISVDGAGLPAMAAWFAQTPYGIAFWQATANLRTMRYVPGPQFSPYNRWPGRPGAAWPT